MARTATESIATPSREDFAAMLEAELRRTRARRRIGGERAHRRDRERFRRRRCRSEDRRPRAAEGILDARHGR